MRRIAILLLAALCALLPVTGAAAQNSTIRTEVPASHTITINCGEGGSITVDGKTYMGKRTLEVPRLSTVTLQATPSNGCALNKIEVTPTDGVTIADGTITLTSVYEPKTITVSFKQLPPSPTDKPADPTEKPADPTEKPADPTQKPTAKPTAKPANPAETAAPVPASSEAPTAAPEATEAPTFPPVPPEDNVLYDEYLGTGEGLGQLFIVFDGEYAPQGNVVLPIVTQNQLLVCADPDEKGQAARRSMILSASQIQRIQAEDEMSTLMFRNGGITTAMDANEVCTGSMAKVIALATQDGLSVVDLSAVSLDELPEAQLSHEQLAQVDVEVCVIPQALPDGREGYTIQAFLRLEDEQLDVSDLMPSLTVGLHVDDLLTDDNRDTFTEQYAIVRIDENGEELLECELRQIPEDPAEQHPDESEQFDVTIQSESPYPLVIHNESEKLEPYRAYVLAVPYAGDGVYAVTPIVKDEAQ